ncbi:MAG TPA: superoxide dismutase family protein [Tepidisphaeraceae bacterium]|nr:superoxide dismutase family protein [Tepidisphaeraceae bacterium]
MSRTLALLVCLAAASAFGCEPGADNQGPTTQPADASGEERTAVANIVPSKAASTQPGQGQPKGTITFHQTDDEVHISGEISGLQPNSRHGIHIHETGDLSAPDLSSAGGHFNPDNHPHGAPATQGAVHAGDLGNLEANDQGVAKMDLTVENITLGAGENNVVGKPVIIHAKADDLKSQPSGDAGARIGGGIIELQE